MARAAKIDYDCLHYLCNIERSRRSFWDYCNVLAPSFYTNERTYLKTVCNEFQAFEEGDGDVLIINLPPRFGKSRTACLFVEWLFGKHPEYKIMTGSYNETLSITFSSSVRDTIMTTKADKYRIVYSDIFSTKIKRGDAAKKLWRVEGSEVESYLATSPTGTATGFGADYIIIDDLIKSASEALNPTVLQKQWTWFCDTMYSRREGRRKIVIIMTQWATRDLAHLAYDHFSKIGLNVKQICLNAISDDGKMLDDKILPYREFKATQETISPVIFEANYLNHAVDLVDALYGEFKTYKLHELPDKREWKYVVSQTDTADEGGDFLCKIIAARVSNLLYVLDVYYTQDKMEITEPEAAKRDLKFAVNYDRTESNNGGKGWARNVERLYRSLGGTLANFSWQATTVNKEATIRANATGVQNVFVFPVDWATRWPQFYAAVALYSNTGSNEHDDGPDCLTKMYIKEFESPTYRITGGISM